VASETGLKRFRGTLIAGILIGCLLAFTIYDTQRSKAIEEQKERESRVSKFTAPEIHRIELESRTGKTILEKDKDGWQVRAPLKDVGDEAVMQSFLASIEGEKIASVVAEKASDLAPYGLDQPSTTVRLADSRGDTQTLQFGSIKAYDGSLYALDQAKPGQVLSVNSNWDVLATKPAKDFRSHSFYRGHPKQDFDSIRVKVRRAKSDFELTKKDGQWMLKTKEAGTPKLSQDAISGFVELVKTAGGTEFVSESVKTESDLLVTLSSADSKFSIRIDAAEGKTPIGASSDVPDAMKVTEETVANLAKLPENFFDKRSAFDFDAKDVVRAEISAPRSGPGGLQRDLDGTKLKELIERVQKLEVIRYLGPTKSEKAKMDSKIRFLKADGSVVFEFEWGPVVFRMQPGGVEAQWVPARASTADWLLGLTKASIDDLKLESL